MFNISNILFFLLFAAHLSGSVVGKVKVGAPVTQVIDVRSSSASDSRYTNQSLILETLLIPQEIKDQEMIFEVSYKDALYDYYHENDYLGYVVGHFDSRDFSRSSSQQLIDSWEKISATTDLLVSTPGSIISSLPKNFTFQTYGSMKFYQGIFGAWLYLHGKEINVEEKFVVQVQGSTINEDQNWIYTVTLISDEKIFYELNVRNHSGIPIGKGGGSWDRDNLLKGTLSLSLKYSRGQEILKFVSE